MQIPKPPEAIKTGYVNRDAIVEMVIRVLQLEIKLQREKIDALESALKKLTQ